MAHIDRLGYRTNVGIVIVNDNNQLFWGRRANSRNAWQFPQGGVDSGEDPRAAMYRELYEEVGLKETDVELLSEGQRWLRYRLPTKFIRYHSRPLCIGQKQKWFLLRLASDDGAFNLEATGKPEFDKWQWVHYWYPVKRVVSFKRRVYRDVLKEFKPILFPEKEHEYEQFERFDNPGSSANQPTFQRWDKFGNPLNMPVKRGGQDFFNAPPSDTEENKPKDEFVF